MRFLLGVFASWIPTLAVAGVSFTLEGQDKQRMNVFIQGNKLRAEEGSPEPLRITLLDADSRKLTVIDPKRKTYSEIDEAQIKAMGSKMNQQLKDAMEKASPEQRKQMEAVLAQRGSGSSKKVTIAYVPTGERSTIAGYPCEGYRQLKDGKPESEGCFIPWTKLGIPKSEFDAYAKLSSFAGSLVSGFQTAHEDPEDRARQVLEKSPGFPARQVHVLPTGQKSGEQVLVSIRQGAITADKFQAPADFTKTVKAAMGGR
jgi:hypothetical protein